MKIALYQPDIAGNVGTIMRMCACLNMGLDIIEPCGFPFNDKKIRRSSMDYYDFVNMNRFNSFDEFRDYNKNSRIVLLSTKCSLSCYDFEFKNDDILLAGRESAGVPKYVHDSIEARIVIPMKNGMRCLNVAVSLSFVVGLALGRMNYR